MRTLTRLVPLAALAAVLVIAGCTPRPAATKAPVVNRGTPTSPTNPPTGLTNRVVTPADDSGIVTYDGYQAVVARQGDTVATVADRIGLSASALGSYNGLQPTHPLRAGDELVLPPRPGGYNGSGASLSAPVTATLSVAAARPIQQTPLTGQGAPAAPAAPAGTEVAAADSAGWSPAIAAAAIDRAVGLNDDGTLAAPPSSGDPVPPEPRPARALASPDLGQYQTGQTVPPEPAPATAPVTEETVAALGPPPTGAALRLRRPVQGPVAIGFNRGAGPAKNDGVDFAAPAGSPVVAAADGTVALVSQSLGGLGTIVLVRHPDEYLTVYGRIENVSVRKGDILRSGQQIGTVSDAAAPAEPRMHFEVRRGAESLDPMQFL